MKKLLWVISVLVVAILVFTLALNHKPVDFTTQVKPILNKNCITCHGGVRQKGGFSLLFREEALAKIKSGKFAISPGDPDHTAFTLWEKPFPPEPDMKLETTLLYILVQAILTSRRERR